MRIFIFMVLLMATSRLWAEQTKTVFNPYTGDPDFITRLDSTTIVAGTCISVSCTNGICTITATCGGGGTKYILMEDGTDILQEDGTKILTEN